MREGKKKKKGLENRRERLQGYHAYAEGGSKKEPSTNLRKERDARKKEGEGEEEKRTRFPFPLPEKKKGKRRGEKRIPSSPSMEEGRKKINQGRKNKEGGGSERSRSPSRKERGKGGRFGSQEKGESKKREEADYLHCFTPIKESGGGKGKKEEMNRPLILTIKGPFVVSPRSIQRKKGGEERGKWRGKAIGFNPKRKGK